MCHRPPGTIAGRRSRFRAAFSWLGLALVTGALVGCGSTSSLRRELPWVRDVEFVGNERIDDGKLESLMSLKPPSLIHPFRRSYYFRDLLEKDLADIRDFYRDRGFLDFQVVEIDEQLDERRTTVRLVITVREGDVSRVASIGFENATVLSTERMRGIVKLREGQPFSPFVSRGDLERLRTAYLDEGYFFARIGQDLREAPDGVHVVYQLSEGRPARLRGVSATGNDDTRSRDITREVTLRRGDLYKRSKLLETQKRLADLGLFSSVRPRTIVADTALGLVDLQIEVRERKHGWYGFGFGFWSDERVRVSAEWGHRNVGGAARRIRVNGTLAWDVDSLFIAKADRSPAEDQLRATWVEPWVFGTRTEGNFNAYREFEQQPQAFEYRTLGLRTTFRRDLSRFVDLFLTFENEWVSSNDTTLAARDFVTRSVRVELERDSRDNVLDPRRGSYQKGSVQWAGLQGDYGFVKSIVSTSDALPQNARRDRLIAYRIEGGFIEPISSPRIVTSDPDRLDKIPYQDRFFLGGATSLRGYRREDVGPLGEDGVTRGGSVIFLANVEYRFPIIWRIRGGVFIDAGNIWSRPEELKLHRLVGEFTGGYSPMDLRYSAGLGMRIHTPVGPLRVDYGHKLGAARGVFERDREFHFSLGHAF